MSSFDLSRFRLPLGSLIVDSALVAALIYAGGQMTERLEQIATRVDRIEAAVTQTNGAARIMVLERRVEEMSEWKVEMRTRLDRIEDKIDDLRKQQR